MVNTERGSITTHIRLAKLRYFDSTHHKDGLSGMDFSAVSIERVFTPCSLTIQVKVKTICRDAIP